MARPWHDFVIQAQQDAGRSRVPCDPWAWTCDTAVMAILVPRWQPTAPQRAHYATVHPTSRTAWPARRR